MSDTETGWAERFAAQYREDAAYLASHGLYDPAQEHEACGVGLIASVDGTPRRDVVESAIAALQAVWHRGAVDADGKTGDGAGIHVQIPQAFFREHAERTGHQPDNSLIAVGQVFLPRTDFDAMERCRCIVETEILGMGYAIYGWRQVPIDVGVIGAKANATRPEIEQIMIANNKGRDIDALERDLYVIRRRIEKAVRAEAIQGFYICSLSCRSIIYKGMFLAEQLTAFYPDLLDERFVSNFAIYHQRYSTNTFPSWPLAQPFRMLAHNGEINTLRGNQNWMAAHETLLKSPLFGRKLDDVKPVIQPGSSDSAALDQAFELLCRAGRSAPLVKTLMIPEAWSEAKAMPDSHRHLYSYCNSLLEPWDGPAAITACDGHWAIAGMDRNGLRPMRYTLTGDGLLIAGSETGMVKVDESRIQAKGRLGPGHVIGVDLARGGFYGDRQLKDMLAADPAYAQWARGVTRLGDLEATQAAPTGEAARLDRGELRRRQTLYGLTMEDMEIVLHPMVETGKEAVGSMGDDTPLAVLSDRYRPLHHYFRQEFAQVTNPAIDPLRESRVMSLATRYGNLGNILDTEPDPQRIVELDSPVLTNDQLEAVRAWMGESAAELGCTFAVEGDTYALRNALRQLRQSAEEAVRRGTGHLILNDEAVDDDRAPIPMILATAAVHSHLVRQSLRSFASINVRAGECLDPHYFAVLIGVGATTVNPYLAQEAVADRHRRGLFGELSLPQAMASYVEAVNQGLLKVMSKMGISVISSYRGGYNFEAVGLSRALVAEYFPGMTSRISGIGLDGIQKKVLGQHEKAYDRDVITLPVGGFFRYRRGGELHAYEGALIHTLQTAVATDSYATFRKWSAGQQRDKPIALRDLLGFKSGAKAVSPDDVESITAIRKRFVTPGMSLGAMSPEAHGTLNVAMNRIGAKSDSGEGGEDPARFTPDANGDNWNSAIKQCASGRFGVTAEYLNQCVEIEIKVAQGAKPGEGGQLPGFKVTAEIARLRHATQGVTLISPPPHHDIYSIEDLAQLIYDLKQINPDAKVCVKLVAKSGIGTIAAGVAKAKADVILVAGNVGGTGASPQTSIKYAGIPWEMGLSEVHQVLMLNGLRNRVTLRTDGGIKTGRDVVMAAMLGAEEYGIGTMSLVAMGCIMVRQCHANTCPVGVCTQDHRLREKFTGTAEKVINLLSFLAEEVREILAGLGFRSLNDAIGRTDLLAQVSRGAAHLDDLDLNPILAKIDPGQGETNYCTQEGRSEVADSLDATMIADAGRLLTAGEKLQLTYTVRNTYRAIGTRLSSLITRNFGMFALQPGHVTVRLRGSAGQSLGAWAVQGLKLEVFGDANDYVGKGLSGGTIVVRPLTSSPLTTYKNCIIGNVVLYGATAGRLFAAGQAGDRFCVRNSDADAVIEGCGSNGCEYMTGGTAVILGPVGDNFAAGMTGGMAFVYDAEGTFPDMVNPDSVIWQRIEVAHWEEHCLGLIRAYVDETGSAWGAKLLNDWALECDKVWQVVPKEMVGRLSAPLTRDEAAVQAIPAE